MAAIDSLFYVNGTLFFHIIVYILTERMYAFKPWCLKTPRHHLCTAEPERPSCVIAIQKMGTPKAQRTDLCSHYAGRHQAVVPSLERSTMVSDDLMCVLFN